MFARYHPLGIREGDNEKHFLKTRYSDEEFLLRVGYGLT